jgi:trans-aconitate methyltransferase
MTWSGCVPFDYQPEEFWKALGPDLAPPGGSSPEQAAVEKELIFLLGELEEIGSVVDVGCGQGRLAALLAEALPKATYSGVDLAAAQLEGTRKVRPDGTFFLSTLQNFQPDQQWDLAICSEVLMHIPPADMQQAADRLKALARKYVITVDWTKPLHVKIAPWNWLHAYREYLGEPDVEIPSGDQSLFLWKMPT